METPSSFWTWSRYSHSSEPLLFFNTNICPYPWFIFIHGDLKLIGSSTTRLTQTQEKRPRESILRAEFANAIDYINQELSEENHLRFLHWDLNKHSRRCHALPLHFLSVIWMVTLRCHVSDPMKSSSVPAKLPTFWQRLAEWRRML